MKEMKLDRKTRYTRKVLADSLIELMKDKPFTKITIKELCEKADINRTTFYAHYHDQYELLKQIEEETFGYIEDMLNKYYNKRSKREVLEMVEEILGFIANNSRYLQVLLSENGDFGFQKRLFSHFMFKKQVMKYFSEDTIKEETKEYWYIYALNGTIGLVQHWLKNNMPIPVSELAKIVVKVGSVYK
ncbi:MAG: TetR/AcrR family transcriptional regulator C-terminal domain-containing protein [Treponema sp.]|jgi:AcrR family transcriptional regulator|nr:TetR/AcrR family transcriptional regulator C-terminal domain-containing protein [Treponema sp.]